VHCKKELSKRLQMLKYLNSSWCQKVPVPASYPYIPVADVSQELAYISPNTQGTCNFLGHTVIGRKKDSFSHKLAIFNQGAVRCHYIHKGQR
jgi:hypothetical protein